MKFANFAQGNPGRLPIREESDGIGTLVIGVNR
jgi:hypothetical protein